VKVLIDENLSPALAKALDALFGGEHEVEHIRIKFGPNVTDAEWIRRLSEEGHWVVISGDARIARRKTEQAAFRNSRLIGFFLAPAGSERIDVRVTH
jgi:predicted nuclease of predicted toxin-antitoxin system